MPLFDVQVAPGLKYFAGVQSITIYDYNGADVTMPHYMGNYPALTPASVQCEGKTGQCPGLVGVTALNCSGARGCKFSGLTMISASGYEGAGAHVPAVRVWDGDVDSVTILSSQITGASDVLDGDNIPVGCESRCPLCSVSTRGITRSRARSVGLSLGRRLHDGRHRQ